MSHTNPVAPALPRIDAEADVPQPFGYAEFAAAVAELLDVDPDRSLRDLLRLLTQRMCAWEASHTAMAEAQVRLHERLEQAERAIALAGQQRDETLAEKDRQLARATAAYQHLLASVNAMMNG